VRTRHFGAPPQLRGAGLCLLVMTHAEIKAYGVSLKDSLMLEPETLKTLTSGNPHALTGTTLL
jgi:hypothetical protein